jgi:hypothetical protein
MSNTEYTVHRTVPDSAVHTAYMASFEVKWVLNLYICLLHQLNYTGCFSYVLTLDPLERPNPTPTVGVHIFRGATWMGFIWFFPKSQHHSRFHSLSSVGTHSFLEFETIAPSFEEEIIWKVDFGVTTKVSVAVNLHSKRRTRFDQNRSKVCPNLTRNSFGRFPEVERIEASDESKLN